MNKVKRKEKNKLADPDDFVIVENSPLNVSKENSVESFLRPAALHIIDIDTIVDEVQEEEEAETENFIFDTKCYDGEDANISILEKTVSKRLKWCKTMKLTDHRELLELAATTKKQNGILYCEELSLDGFGNIGSNSKSPALQ